jgi:4-amino-4-deoxy-L-arabinose transferase-like glycosyltransferase
VLVVGAITIRLVLWLQISGTALADLHQWTESDMNYYHQWATDIASGDWLSRRLPLPVHEWHVETAQQYFASHPEAARRDADAAARAGQPPVAYAWATWMHPPQFYQDPLYPYLLAATYLVAGVHPHLVFVWQFALGVLSILLIYDLARRRFGETVGRVAGAMAALSGPLVYYEVLLLRESAMVAVCLATAWLTDRALARERRRDFVMLGALLGAGILLKSSLLLLAAGVIAGVVVIYRSRAPQRSRALGLMAAGAAIVIGPLIARNVAVGVPPLSLASAGPLTFVTSNEATSQPEQGNFINTEVLARFLGETDGGWGAAWQTVVAGHTATSFAQLVWRKWTLAWHWYELPNNEDFYYARARVPLLRWLPVTAWVISPLALVGVCLGVRHARKLWILYALVLVALAPLVLFYVLGRFRVLLLAAALPFAAMALVELVRAAANRQWGRSGLIAAATIVLGLWTAAPLAAGRPLVRTDDWLVPYVVRYQPAMRAAGERGDWATAGRACQAYFTEAPDPAAILASGDPDLPALMSDVHRRCAAMWERAGERVRAAAENAAADALARGTAGD